MSEEDKDVAMQLIRLCGGPSQARRSGSAVDDTFSGRADAASSVGATSDAGSSSEDEEPAARRQKLDSSGNHKRMFGTTSSHFAGPKDSAEASADESEGSDGAEKGTMAAPGKNRKLKANTLSGAKARPQSSPKMKTSKVSKPKVKKTPSATVPMTPASLPASRKPSVASNPAFSLGPGEEEQPDLSTKPRCQRCRKSKKGCDRQRPCGRCRDAGIPAELCISEDEGNGRKGRYGRHMGVPIKREDMPPPAPALLPAAPVGADMAALAATANPAGPAAVDKNKKRKR
ncbi:3f33f159-9c04-43c5-a5a6-e5a856459ac4 [Thermothielavioides terrestris]|uniref:3f33f159-9c04-43c5-a5a6-e5a856459ac4 n=1 Tax=Thermothielavioides terrestris TaxID=2587410 RepID=A0A3S4B546_9PEZI|nr:3f33f159-9c04-43c5-a5a6-e5a856459ac4 [Thermothielavioides terrestris]